MCGVGGDGKPYNICCLSVITRASKSAKAAAANVVAERIKSSGGSPRDG